MNSSVACNCIGMSFAGTVWAGSLSHSFAVFALVHASASATNKGIHAGSRLARSRKRWISNASAVRCHFFPITNFVVLSPRNVYVRSWHSACHSLACDLLRLEHHGSILVLLRLLDFSLKLWDLFRHSFYQLVIWWLHRVKFWDDVRDRWIIFIKLSWLVLLLKSTLL